MRRILPYLTTEFSIYGLQPVDDDYLEGTTRSFDEITERFGEIVTRRKNNRSVYLLGYSFAGYLAYEIACKLINQGVEVARLMLLDTAGPTLRQQRKTAWQQVLKAVEIAKRPRSTATTSYMLRKIERLGNSVRKRIWFANMKPTPTSQLRARRLYSRALEHHQFERFPGKIDLVQCTQGRLLRLEPEANGWLPWAEGGVQVHQVDATHAGLPEPTHAPVVAKIIEALMTSPNENRAAA